MITLTTPPIINSVIGGNSPVNYDKFSMSNIVHEVGSNNVRAALKITSTSNPDMTALNGTLTINFANAIAEVAVPQLDFYRRIALSGPQQNAVAALVSTAQDRLEEGLITLGLVSGTQSTGA